MASEFGMIGILDSGIGGLTTARALTELLPDCDILYFGDTARAPYGNRSPEAIIAYALEGAAFLLQSGANLIVISSHSIAAVASEALAERFDVPIFEGITPSAEFSLNISRKLSIGIIGARAIINSRIYEKKIKAINPEARVYSAACPLLVHLIEEGALKKPETNKILKKYLIPLKVRQIDTLIPSCAHYAILKKSIQRKIGMRVKLVDPSALLAEHVKQFIETHPETAGVLSKTGKSSFFVSDMTEHIQKTAQAMFGKNIRLEAIKSKI